MTPVAIAYFKHFLHDQNLVKYYLATYRKRHQKKNPESVEQFLKDTSAGRVITDAFYFRVNGNPSFDYWKEIDDKWQQYWSMNKENYSNATWMFLKGTFAILRFNWDSTNGIYDKESLTDTYKRLGILSPYDETPDKTPEPTTESEAAAPEDQPLIDFGEQDEDPLSDFEFFDTGHTHGGMRLKGNEASINIRKGSYKITFNLEISDVISKSGLRLARLAKNKAGDICIIFNNREGMKIIVSDRNNSHRESVTINSKELAIKLGTLLNITSEYSRLNIEQLSSTNDYLIYKLTRK